MFNLIYVYKVNKDFFSPYKKYLDLFHCQVFTLFLHVIISLICKDEATTNDENGLSIRKTSILQFFCKNIQAMWVKDLAVPYKKDMDDVKTAFTFANIFLETGVNLGLIKEAYIKSNNRQYSYIFIDDMIWKDEKQKKLLWIPLLVLPKYIRKV